MTEIRRDLLEDAVCNFLGTRIFLSSDMVSTVQIREARSWRERFLTWPWRPFKKTKKVTVILPSKEVVLGEDMLIMHPETFKAFKQLSFNERHHFIKTNTRLF